MIAGRILIVTVMMILAGGWSVDISAYQSLGGGPASIISQGAIPLTQSAVLDDFASDSSLNKWNCVTGTFGSILTAITQPGYCAKSWDAAGQALKIDYDVRNLTSYSGYFTQMGGASLVTPTAYTAVSFSVKGAVGGEFFKIELKNTGSLKYWDATEATNYYRNTASVYVNDFHEDGKVTTAWRKVTIPLNNFANLDSFSSMKEIVFTFENNMSSQNSSPTQGTIYIDNITFETTAVSAIQVDSFKDKVMINSLGGNMGISTGGGATGQLSFASISDTQHAALNALKYDFDVSTPDSYAAAFFIFGGGYTDDTVEKPDKGGWIKVPQNFNSFHSITFWARAESDAKNPFGFKVELHDFLGTGTGEPFRAINLNASNHLTAIWQKYTISFDSFKDYSDIVLDKTRIAEMVFTLEYWNTASNREIGTIYIDDVQFE